MDRHHRDPREHYFRDPREHHRGPRDHHRDFMDDDDEMEDYMDYHHHRHFDPRMAEEKRTGKNILF